MIILNEKEKDFILDAVKFLELKYSVVVNDFKNDRHSDESNETLAVRKLDSFILKNIYKIGLEDYGVSFSYKSFIDALIEGYRTRGVSRGGSSFRFFMWREREPTKYRKMPHHKKKEKTLKDIDKAFWKKKKIKKRSCYTRHFCDYDWEIQKMEKDKKREAEKDLDSFLEESTIDTKGLILSL